MTPPATMTPRRAVRRNFWLVSGPSPPTWPMTACTRPERSSTRSTRVCDTTTAPSLTARTNVDTAVESMKVEQTAYQNMKELPGVGKHAFSIGEMAFHALDTDTPCRVIVAFTAKTDKGGDAAKAVLEALTPAAIK